MLKFAIAVVALSGLTLAQEASAPVDNCKGGCSFFCSVTASACVDLPPFVDCAANKQACAGLCNSVCSCFTGCTDKCNNAALVCKSAQASKNALEGVLCKAQVSVCSSTCPLVCATQVLTNDVPNFVIQTAGGLAQALGLGQSKQQPKQP
ncbi:uncharacterized protein LOC101863582 [Aplysia californica]|uniref:Uncharacterized protein LOC101863582 n=1 Tax=Aplysia californica TaxID=6500 RepID=A0ABM0JN46_APLCA|nr:uncharacterized protein LOC101863582 [Aplysia californica]